MAPHACSCVRDLRLETSELFMLAVGWVKTSVDSAWRILALGAVGRVKNSGKGAVGGVKNSGKGDGRGCEKFWQMGAVGGVKNSGKGDGRACEKFWQRGRSGV